MPLNHDILSDQHLVCAASTGRLAVEDLVGHVELLAADARYRSPMKVLIDLRASEPSGLGSAAYRMFAAAKVRHLPKLGGETCAIVASGDLDYGLCRLHAAHLEPLGLRVEVFRDLQAAMDWLELVAQPAIEAALEPLARVS